MVLSRYVQVPASIAEVLTEKAKDKATGSK
jgi:hypothetical protein